MAYTRDGQLILLEGHFWKAAFSGVPYLLMEIEASLWQVGLSTKLEEILDLKIFPECFRGPLKTLRRATCGLRVANCPLLAYTEGIFQNCKDRNSVTGRLYDNTAMQQVHW